MRHCTSEFLQYVAECPAKAYFSITEKPKCITETQVYLQTIHQAIKSVLTVPDVNLRDHWLRALKRSKLIDKVHYVSRSFLIANGIRVLWSLSARANKHGQAEVVSRELKLANGTVVIPELFTMKLKDGDLALLFDNDPNANIRKPTLSDPTRKVLACLGVRYCVVSMFTGAISRVKQRKKNKGDLKALTALLAHAAIIKDKRMYYPRAGRHCVQCNWRKSCHKQFKEE